jgi:hypothetical protein
MSTTDREVPPDQGCKLPRDGWYCSRKPGHEGPCAARPIAPLSDEVPLPKDGFEAERLLEAYDAACDGLQRGWGTTNQLRAARAALLNHVREISNNAEMWHASAELYEQGLYEAKLECSLLRESALTEAESARAVSLMQYHAKSCRYISGDCTCGLQALHEKLLRRLSRSSPTGEQPKDD